MKKPIFFTLLFSPLVAWAQGEQKQVFGQHEVHYMLLNTKELAPKVAQAYDIPRSSKLAFLSISVLENQDGNALPKPIPALVSAQVKNLVGQVKTIELTEIRETGAIYYVGTLRFEDQVMHRFTFEVKTHADQPEPYVVQHQQKLYEE